MQVPLDLRPLDQDSWGALLAFCKARDVEEGESDDFMYSVRQSTGALTVWTRKGWREGYYVARVLSRPKNKGLVKLMMEPGNGPEDRNWSQSKLEMHVRELHSRLLPAEKAL